jgi:hypothetical protein
VISVSPRPADASAAFSVACPLVGLRPQFSRACWYLRICPCPLRPLAISLLFAFLPASSAYAWIELKNPWKPSTLDGSCASPLSHSWAA